MSRIAAALLLVLALAAGGCGANEKVVPIIQESPAPTAESTVPVAGSRAVTVDRGETLVVDLGDQNESVGDGWFLVGPPDPAVLTDEGRRSDPDCDQPGCGAAMSWHFGTAGAGTTDVTLQYCYRSRPPGCEPMPDRGPADPVTLTVTVK